MQLIDTGQGQQQKFDYLDLQGIRLSGADLTGSSFVKTNLQTADLRRSNLTNANLVGAILKNTDLTAARLTGSVIRPADLVEAKNWMLAECDYTYVQKLDTQGLTRTERVPKDSNKTFRAGEFVRWIEKNSSKTG